MAKEPPSNIFDEAGKHPKKTPPPPVKKAPAPPPSKISNEEVTDIIQRIRTMRQQVDKQVENFYKTAGIPETLFEEYFNDPRNFTPDLWSRIEGERDAFQAKIGDIVHVEFKKKKVQQVKEKPTKERKGKTLGSRKGWMPMK